MNVERACSLLGVSPHEIHTPKLKKNYRKKCLLFHPDKRGDNQKFVELKDAYDLLCAQPKESFLDAFDEKILRHYVHTLQQCNMDVFKHPLFVRYFLDPVQDHLQSYKTYILNPKLGQLLRKDIYYLEEEKIYIPLWHQEIVFHGKIKIWIQPILPKGIEIDEDNNILVPISKNQDKVVLDGISISIPRIEKEKEIDRIILKKKGIPKIGSFIYETQELSDIILLISL
jgi:DnaJ family protein A protein 2